MSELPRLRVSAWASIAALLTILTMVNLAFAPDALEVGVTSYGKTPIGFGAVFELLEELGQAPERSRRRYAGLDAKRPLWLLEPEFLRAGAASEPAARAPWAPRADAGMLRALLSWVEAGGTAVVAADGHSDLEALGLRRGAPLTGERAVASGGLAAAPRTFAFDTALERFEDSEDPDVESRLRVDGAPLVVERRLGEGRLVVIADAQLLRNGLLGDADNALLAVDLVRSYGAPRFDERCHGLLSPRSVAAALGAKRVLLLSLVMGGLGLLFIWHRRAIPARVLAQSTAPDASLGLFVDSLALLYSRKAPRHVAEVFEAYRHGFRHRLRRLLFGSGSASDHLLSRRVARELPDDPQLVALVEGRKTPRSIDQLYTAVRALERYGASATRAIATKGR